MILTHLLISIAALPPATPPSQLPEPAMQALHEHTEAKQKKAEMSEKQIRHWMRELQSNQEWVREQAVAELMKAGSRVLPRLQALVEEGTPLPIELAARRLYGAIAGVAPETAAEVREVLDGVAMEEAIVPEREALGLLEMGAGATRYALERLAKVEIEEDSALARLKRRLTALQAVSDLAAGRNYRDRAGERLEALGDPVIDELAGIAATEDIDGHWRRVATERLFALGGGEALESAYGLAGMDDPGLSEMVAGFLCRHAEVDAFPRVVRALAEQAQTRPELEAHLHRYADQLSSAALRDHLEDRHSSVRSCAAAMLGIRRDEDSREALGKRLRDDSTEVIERALLALGHIGHHEDLAAIRRRLAHREVAVRRAAVQALGSFEDENKLPWMAAGLWDRDPSVRVISARSLGRSGAEDAVAPLIAALDPSGDPAMFSEVTHSLAQLTGQSLATALRVSDSRQRRRATNAWRGWWRERLESDELAAEEEEESEEEGERAVPLAREGARILENVEYVLRSGFRPYGELKERDGTAEAALRAAAVSGLKALLERRRDPDDPDLEVLELADNDHDLLQHLLAHGEFESAADLARAVGSVPNSLAARDYIFMIHEAARAMIDSLGDRFTRLQLLENAAGEIDPDALPSIFGRGETLGMMTEKVEGGAIIEFVFALAPAHRAGLRRGDRVISINGKLTAELESREIRRMLSKPVELMVLRDGWTRPVRFKLEPAVPQAEDLVQIALLPGELGYLRLRDFDLGCAQRIEWALRELDRRGAKGLIFDLRNNPGGTVLDAVNIVDKFVPAGSTITTMWTNTEDEDEEYSEEIVESTDSEADREYPVVVLINECSASAAEMTSGALQDLERAVIVGRTSWGKGIGQSVDTVAGFERRSVFGSSRSSLTIPMTVLEYFLPSGRSIQGIGVEPDVPVSEPVLLGERYESIARSRKSSKMQDYVKGLLEDKPELALELARFDSWDFDSYPEFDDLRDRLRFELPKNLLRMAVRAELRLALAAEHPELEAVDYQEDEDLRVAVSELAAQLELDLAELPEFEDLAE